MIIRTLSFVAFMAAITPAVCTADADKTWPDRTVRIITTPAGSSPDAVARTLADVLAKRWKRPVIVENRSSGADMILVASSFLEARDGHSLLLAPHSLLTVNPLLHGTLPYDHGRDFAPILLVGDDFLCVAAAPSLGVSSLSELVKQAATKPGELNAYAVPGAPHLAWLAFQKQAGISTTFVRYNVGTGLMLDLSGGLLHVAVLPLAMARGQADRIKILAVTNAVRAEAAPR